MDILKIVFSSFASIISLFVLTKIMGNREMAQLSMFDYISSIAIGSIAGEMAVMSTDSIIEPLVSMIILTGCTLAISYTTCKSIILRRFIEGHALLLFQDGQVYEKNLLKAKIDIDELLAECRINGYYDLEEIHTIYLEGSGKISILPMSANRPATPKDLNLSPVQTLPLPNVIIDGCILNKNLNNTGKNEAWIKKQLKKEGIKDMKEVILATYDGTKDALNVYVKYHKKMEKDIFE